MSEAPQEDKVGTALAKVDLQSGGTLAAIVPTTLEQAWRMAQLISRSPFRPKDNNSPEALVIAIMHGLELGLMPMQSVHSIAVINGRPSVWGDAAVGLVSASGKMTDMQEWLDGYGETQIAHCKVTREGRTSPVERTFSVADARRAGLWGKTGPWTQYPQRMLQMRARSWALRDLFADVLKGLAIREEVRDISPAVEAGGPPLKALTAADIMAHDVRTETLPREWADWIAVRTSQAAAATTVEELQEMAADAVKTFSDEGPVPKMVVSMFDDLYAAAMRRVTEETKP